MTRERPLTELEQLMADAEAMGRRRDKVEVRCPECGTTVWKDTIEEAVETAERHEEMRHDGWPTVEVNGMVLPSFTEEQAERIREAIEALEGDDA